MNYTLTKDGGLLVDVSTHVASPDMRPVVFEVEPEDVDAYFTINPNCSSYTDIGEVVMSAVREYVSENLAYE